jgi:hypothetical protein
MCACKETDVRESPNDSTLPGREGQGSHGETCHPQYRESPVSSVAEHHLLEGIYTRKVRHDIKQLNKRLHQNK